MARTIDIDEVIDDTVRRTRRAGQPPQIPSGTGKIFGIIIILFFILSTYSGICFYLELCQAERKNQKRCTPGTQTASRKDSLKTPQ